LRILQRIGFCGLWILEDFVDFAEDCLRTLGYSGLYVDCGLDFGGFCGLRILQWTEFCGLWIQEDFQWTVFCG